LLSSAAGEVRRLFERARDLAALVGKPVRCWVSDKQDAFVTGVREVFPGVPHRYCGNHFLRDAAKPVLEADSHAKVQMRRKVRGLRDLERRMLAQKEAPAAVTAEPVAPVESVEQVVLDYCSAVRGILNDDQGGPLHPPGMRMAEALGEVQDSIGRAQVEKKGGAARER
jgi:hypothetical protein